MDKWIIFDAMGVIFTVGDDTNELLVPFVMERNKDLTREYINEVYRSASLGEISSNEFWRKMKVCKEGEEEAVCKAYLDTCLTIDSRFIQVAKRLKENYKLAILSNDVSEWFKYLREKFGLDALVEFAVISGDVKCRKPDCRIYEIAIEKTGVAPENCIFIDDSDKNLLAAQREGMKVIRFFRGGEACKIEDIHIIKEFNELYNILEKAL